MDEIIPAAYEGLETVGEAERWEIGASERLYDSPWVALDLLEVVPPRRPAYRHHVVRVPPAVGVVVRRDDGRVLLMHRHRFVTGTVGFEIPAGGLDDGESVEDAARREVLEETGLHLDRVRPFYECSPSDGVTDQRFHLLLGTVAEDAGVVVDDHESAVRVWVDRDEVAALVRDGRIPGALTSVALLHGLWSGWL